MTDQEELTILVNNIADQLVQVDKNVSKRFEEIDKLIDNIEQRIASLVVGFGEQTVVIESLVSQLAYSTEEERQSFRENVAEARKEMLELLQGLSDAVEETSPEPEPSVE